MTYIFHKTGTFQIDQAIDAEVLTVDAGRGQMAGAAIVSRRLFPPGRHHISVGRGIQGAADGVVIIRPCAVVGGGGGGYA